MTEFILIFIISQSNSYLVEKRACWELKNRYISIDISKSTGEVTNILVKDKNDHAKHFSLHITGSWHHNKQKIVEVSALDKYPNYGQININMDSRENSVELRFLIDSISLYCEMEILGKNGIEKEIKIDFSISETENFDSLFYPCLFVPITTKTLGSKILEYRRDIAIPILSLYNSSEDYGLSVIAPLEIPKSGLSFTIDREVFTVSYSHVRLTSKRKSKAAIYIVPHAGDWRPGFGFLLNKYPEYFYPEVENTKVGEGWYFLGGPFNNKNQIVHVKNRRVKWIELHGHFPFYGLYAPEQMGWDIIMNSDIVSLNDWEKGFGEKRNNYRKMHNLIKLWHTYGIQVYLYFQSFEAWHQYAEKYFSNDIARNKSSMPHLAWKLCNLMNPDPMSKWGKYIIHQANNLIKKYPEIDGIFYDRMDYWNYDLAHDDGITMIDNRPFAMEKINEQIFQIFHKNNKGIWGNGPSSIEVCKNLDGIMAETSLSMLQKIQFLGLVRPIIFLAYDRNAKDTENKLKNALICGAFPSITYGDIECQKLDEKYIPLFDLIKNRRWVLSNKPIEIPEGFRGNIFRTPDGNYTITIIKPEKSQLIPHPFEYNTLVTVNVPDAHKIQYAYVLSGDWAGINALDFSKGNGSIKISLPYHLSSSLIYLTKKREYDLVRISSPILIKGEIENLIFFIDNFAKRGVHVLEIETPWFKETENLTSDMITFRTIVPKDIEGEVEIKVRYNGTEHKLSCWVVDAISITPKEDIFIKFDEGENILFYITNNLNRKVSIDLSGRFIKGTGKVKKTALVVLQPLENKEIKIPIVTKTEGTFELTAVTEEQKIKELFPLKAGLFFSKNDLFHDDFKNGMEKWTLNRGKWNVVNDIVEGIGSSHFAFIKNIGWKNYEFEVRTKILGSDNPAVDWLKSYIFFRLQDEENFYRFGIHGDAGVVDLYKYVKGEWIRLGSSFFKPERNKWYALRVRVKDTKIVGYINGEVVIETNDNTFSTGGIGIGVLEDGMKCNYKDIVVKKL